jgi:hypothetical protein
VPAKKCFWINLNGIKHRFFSRSSFRIRKGLKNGLRPPDYSQMCLWIQGPFGKTGNAKTGNLGPGPPEVEKRGYSS